MNAFTGRLPLSAAQSEVWIAHQLDRAGTAHNCSGYVDIQGELDGQLLAEAVRLAVGEAEAMRVRFETDADGTPRQVPLETVPGLRVHDLSGAADARAAAERWMRADLDTPADLSRGPLFAHTLLKVAADHHLLHFRYHHIVLDGYGQALHWRRLAEHYTALAEGRPARPGATGTLAELVAEDAEYRASERFEQDRSHWAGLLADWPEPAGLSSAGEDGPAASRFQPPARITGVDAAAAHHRVHWSVVVLAATAVYLHRVTRQQELVLGLPVRGRTGRTALTTPGMLANVLPLRIEVRPEQDFAAIVRQVADRVAEALAHQLFRGEEIGREIRRGGGDPTPAAVVNVVSFDGALRFGALSCAVRQLSSGPIADLGLEFFGGADGADVRLTLEPNPDRHRAAPLAAHRARLTRFVQELLATADHTPVGTVELLTPRDAATATSRGPERDYDLDRPLHAWIEDQAARTPDALAVETADETLTYRQLLDGARALAHHLRGLGVRPGQVVGVHQERSADLVTALLGVLLAGAAYTPLDPEQPAARLALQIEDAEVSLVLTRTDLAARLGESCPRTLALDALLPGLPAATGPLGPTAGAQDPAYVIFTSGSTGRPKGVAVPHRGIVNRLLWMQDEYRLGTGDKVLQKTPFTFDVSVWEFFWPLMTGAALHLIAPGAHRDPRAIADTVRRHAVTTAHFVPSMLDLFLAEPTAADLPTLRRVACSGEALRPETIGRFFATYGPHGPELHNLYGPTEASVDVTHWRCRPEDAAGPVPIGRPVANTTLHVLDRAGRPLPAGVPGELCVGGVQVALGYLNRPDLTAAAFVPGPGGAGRLYRTGDLAVLRPDGVALYHGRLDHQVKVHGFRIEPGEVESALLAHPGVARAVVTAPRLPGGDVQLVAHLVPAADALPGHAELTAFLRERLPAYMVPAHLVAIPELPLLANGKLDRKALPLPAATAPARSAEPPATDDERLLHAAWATVLGTDAFGVDDSFFALGGDSMHAIRVRAEAERHGVTFAVADLFQGPSVRELARLLSPLDETRAQHEPFALLTARDRALLPEGLDDAYPLSAMQAGMLFHAAFAEDTSIYRVVTSIRIAAPLDRDALRAAVDDTTRRHPSLRCSFDLARYSEPLQLVHHEVAIPIEDGEDLRGLTPAAQQRTVEAWVEQAKFTTFDPAVAPLLKFAVHPCDDDSFELSVIEHHVVLDGWSDMRMLEEIVEHYAARAAGTALDLPPVASAYRDFVAAERAAGADPAARAFWSDLLRGAEPTELAPRPAGETRAAANQRYDVPIPRAAADALRATAAREALPLKALLVAAHAAVLRLVGGADEVLTGMVANGRLEERGGDETIGVFLNTLPLRLDLADATLLDTARAVFAHERAAAPHRRYPIAQIQHDLGEELHLSSYVNFMDFHREAGRAADALMRVTVGIAETNYPLAVNFLVDPEQRELSLWLDCDLAVLPEEFCDRLAGYYARAVEEVAHRPGRPAVEADLLGAGELARLTAWNATATGYDRADTVHGLIARQAAARPGATALAHRHDAIDYAELEARANRLAHHLIDTGVRRGDLVGVSVRRGIDLVTALVAVHKAGAAYVPMDPGFPRTRLDTIAEDAAIGCLITGPGAPAGLAAAHRIDLAEDAAAIAARPDHDPGVAVGGDDTAYVIYTSGSTGKPKGTPIRHRNAVNFFVGMDGTVGCGPEDTVLAVTSVSFDISVLELLWPLTRGAKVVVAGERVINNLVPRSVGEERPVSFSLFFFAASAGTSRQDGYRLVLEATKFADRHGFEAVWTPERHFHSFGGLYPNPSVMSAALATVTDRIALRCGSVVAPLHDTVRIAEEWSLVDNLSGGRVGLAFAAGWNSNDFVLRPEAFPGRKQRMTEQLDEFRKLWRGEQVLRTGGSGEPVDVRIHPAPVQAEPPIWLTSVGNVETFEKAGASGANLLTHLLGQAPEDLAVKISAYRKAREAAGHPGPGQVTLMVHTFMAEDTDDARARAREPFRDYLRSSTELWRTLFATTGQDLPEMGAEDQIEAVIDLAIDRYFEASGLFGSPEDCAELVRSLSAAGVDEIACLVDFGVSPDEVLDSLGKVDELRRAHEAEVVEHPHSLAALCARHGVTLLQGTPSLFAAVAAEPEALEALTGLRALLIGGEAFPSGLAQRLLGALPDVRVLNMYGPTETTIWSTVHELDRDADTRTGTIPIGRPIANTVVRVADPHGRPAPIGGSGELWIGGDGVAVGYLGRPELTADRFVDHDGHRYYRTGDRVRWRADGRLEFLGRVDRQVKILGHRVEPDEVESVLSRHEGVDAVAVIAVDGAHGPELVAYVSPAEELSDDAVQQAHVQRWGEVWESAYTQPDDGSEFAGWLSSYDGEPIPVPEMREWLGHTVRRVRALRPTRVADIGVGVGLVLRNLAEEVAEYHGVDLSPAALDAARASLGRPLPDHVHLAHSGPEYLDGLPADSLDTVVVNSVAQYFPGTDYLRTVLLGALRAVRPGGAVFVGDVRSLDLLPEFHTAVQLHRAGPLGTAEEIRSAVHRQLGEERELCLSPDFFQRLAADSGQVADVRVELKRGRADNELSLFRYDVTLTVGDPAPPAPEAERAAWSELPGGLDALRDRLAADPGRLLVTGVPNRRLTRVTAAVRALADAPADATAWDLDRTLWSVDEDAAVHPEDLHALAEATGHRLTTRVRPDGRLDTFDALFTPADTEDEA
ncbi:amino acid adenylation domain-containing protein [Kitasatospora cineracea]|uniref:amino acid adenylation domain-containing protein n=1 Tax=Kitasatospora cineracea TaxID=88074 RepID=UPI00341C521B